MSAATAEKLCGCCRTLKPVSDFNRAAGRRDGLQVYCKTCKHAYRKAWQREHPEAHRARLRRENQKARPRQTDHWLRKKYGITIDDYEAMSAAQDGLCAICRRAANGKGRLHVDHDHMTGNVRGLLCFTCNAAIGYLGDDPDMIHRAATYLEERS